MDDYVKNAMRRFKAEYGKKLHRVTSPQGKTTTMGDVDFESVSKVAGFLTPVPGGVGPMTVAMLLRNVADACLKI